MFKKDTLHWGYFYGLHDSCYENPILIKFLRFETDRNRLIECYKNGFMECDSLGIPDYHLVKKKASEKFEIVDYYLDNTLIEIRYKRGKNYNYAYAAYSILRDHPPSNELINCNN